MGVLLMKKVVIIGAGVVGCATARELSKYNGLDITVVDKREDVGGDASKSNSAIIHTGYDAAPGTLESQLVVASNPMFPKLVKDLDVPFEMIGAILPAINEEQFKQLKGIKDKAFQNRVYDVEYLTGKEILEMEPNINPEVKGGLLIPREGIIDPFILTVALAENAAANGVKFKLHTEVTGIQREGKKVIAVETNNGIIEADYIINSSGVYCDDIAEMVGKCDYTVNARRGEFFILDKNTSCKVNKIILPIPTKTTKGKLMTPTIHGNMLIGPTADDLKDKEDKSTTVEGLNSVIEDVKRLVPNVNPMDTIKQYTGNRAAKNPAILEINMYDDVKGFVNLSGVRSTGLTASLAIGKYVTDLMIQNELNVTFKDNFVNTRKSIKLIREATNEEKAALIKEDPRYGNIICRCETVSEAEIVQAIHSEVPATSVDAIKRRLKAGFGRCQGGFCAPKIVEILARELKVSPEEINKNVKNSNMLHGEVK
jgi:glycerol-3-phosphate dehydrogenase